MPALVRTAREADVPAIERLVQAAFAPFVQRTGIVPAPMTTDLATVISALGAVVAVDVDRVVGVLVAWPHPDHMLVETMAVDPAEQGRGIGTLLLDVAERLAIDSGVHAVRLYPNALMAENLAFYSRRGFAETGRRVEHGFERVFFEKRL